MRDNKFDSESTREVLSSVLQSSSISTIKSLGLIGSCDFTSDETCTLLAELIDTATQLEDCYICDQVGERKILADLQVASSEEESKAGAIKFINYDTDEMIMSVPTQRTKEVKIYN